MTDAEILDILTADTTPGVLGARRAEEAGVLGARRTSDEAVLGARRSPDTGDAANMAAMMTAMGTASMALGGWAMAKRKRDEKDEVNEEE